MTLRSGGTVLRDPFSRLLRVNGDILVRATIARCYRTFHGKVFWGIRSEPGVQPDITIAARMDEQNEMWVDYVIAPHFSVGYPPLYLRFEQDTFTWNAYRFASLACFSALFSRTGVSDVLTSTASSARMQRLPIMPDVLGAGKIVRQRLSKNTVLVRARRIESEREALVKKGKLAQSWLTFAEGAVRKLLSDDHIEAVLRAENVTNLPSVLAQRAAKRAGLRTIPPGARHGREAGAVDDILHLVVAVCALSQMLQKPRIEQALRQNYPVLLKDLRAVVAVVSPRSAPERSR
jgi:hypothetical protein